MILTLPLISIFYDKPNNKYGITISSLGSSHVFISKFKKEILKWYNAFMKVGILTQFHKSYKMNTEIVEFQRSWLYEFHKIFGDTYIPMQNGVNFIKGINSQISIHQESNKNRIKEDLDKNYSLLLL